MHVGKTLLMTMLTLFVLSGIPVVSAMSSYIPGAHSVTVVHYEDLTTNNPAIDSKSAARRLALEESSWDENGKPHRLANYIPTVKVAGQEISGMIEDCTFVMRIPDNWNGRLVVVGSPGFGSERSTDAMISDYVLTKFDAENKSYAYVACDKGTVGEQIPFPNGQISPLSKALTVLTNDKDSLEEWNVRVHQVTVATKDLLKRTRGQAPVKTYLWGLSNGGYIDRWAAENDADLYDGILDWEGVLWRANDENLISSMSKATNAWEVLKNKQATAEEKQAAMDVFAKLGLPKEASFLLPMHGQWYYLPTLNVHRMKYDPEWKHREWYEYMSHPEDYKDYDWFKRPQMIKDRIAKFENTGNIKKPFISVHGTWDALLFSNVHATAYENLVKENNKQGLFRLYMVENGNHFEGFVGRPAIDPQHKLQPLMPVVHQAFDALVDWVENGIPAPNSQTIAVPTDPNKTRDIWTNHEIDKY